MAASRVLLEEDEKVVGPFTFTSASHAEVTTYSELFGAPVYGSAYEPNSFTAGATLMSLVEPNTATPPEDETTGAYMASGASLPPLFSPAATTAPSVGESLSQQSQHQVPRISPQAFPSSPVPPHSSMDEAIRAFADQVPTYRAVPSEVLDAAPKINRGFSVDSKATQIFMGQLPATITAERLAAAIDVMLEWTDVPLVVHLRPAQGANQASHAIVTVESKDAKAVLSLNRRAYFTGKALYYAAAISDTPTFQRIISKSINSVSGTPDALSGLARACVVVEGANRPKPSNAAAPPRSSPHSAARTPQSTTPPATVQASRGQRQQQQHHHHQPQQPQYVARGRNVGPAPPPYVPAAPPTNCVIATTSPHGFTTVTFTSPMPWAAVPYAPQIIFAPRAGVY